MTDIRLGIVSDVHSGSLYAPMPKRMLIVDDQTGDERIVTPSRLQTKLNALWDAMCKNMGQLDVCLVNGDSCDGVQRGNQGAETWTTNMDVQVDAAEALLKKIHTRHWRFTRGSGYHVGENMPLDKVVAKRMGGTFGNDLILDFKKQGVRLHAAHFIQSSKVWQYATTALARDMLLLRLNKSKQKYGDIQWCVRSHTHSFVGAMYSHTTGFITPAWQTRTPYAAKNGFITPPDIGWLVLTIQGDGRVTLDKDHIYNVGKPSKVVVEG